jgi:hypothetical protein
MSGRVDKQDVEKDYNDAVNAKNNQYHLRAFCQDFRCYHIAPITAIKPLITLPNPVIGYTSPYPTVVSVAIAHQKEARILGN